MLELKKIKKTYKVNKLNQIILDNINICFRDNEFVSILGPSGAGKTTLLNIIGGLDRCDDGDILINGKSTKTFKNKKWDYYRNKYIGFIFQNYNLIEHMSVLDNVMLPLKLSGYNRKKSKNKALKVLKKVIDYGKSNGYKFKKITYEEMNSNLKSILEKENIRVKLDDRDEKLNYKMRESVISKVPYTLILGDKERDAETINYRLRGSNETHTLKIDEFIEKLNNEIKNKE